MNLDHLFNRTWSKDYTCNEFVCEAWQVVVGEDLTQRLEKTLTGHCQFRVLQEPRSPCIVFFSNDLKSSTHVGLFYGNKLLHLTLSGVQYVPLEFVAINFRRVSFYE